MLVQSSNSFPEVTLTMLKFTQALYSRKTCVMRRSSPPFYILFILCSRKWFTVRTTLFHTTYIKLTIHFLFVTLLRLADDPFATTLWILILCHTKDQQKHLSLNTLSAQLVLSSGRKYSVSHWYLIRRLKC